MKNNNNMEMNKMSEADLEQVSGGKFWELFTTEFKTFENSKQQDFARTLEDDKKHFGVSTLEMRANIMDKKEKKDSKKVVKL